MSEQFTPPPFPENMHIAPQPETFNLPAPEQLEIPQIPENIGSKGFFKERLAGLSDAWQTAKEITARAASNVGSELKEASTFHREVYGDRTFNEIDSIKIRFSTVWESFKKQPEKKGSFHYKLHPEDTSNLSPGDRVVARRIAKEQSKANEMHRRRNSDTWRQDDSKLSGGDMAAMMAYEVLSLGPIRMIGTEVLSLASQAAVAVTKESSKPGQAARRIDAHAQVAKDQREHMYTNPVIARKDGYYPGEVRRIKKAQTRQLKANKTVQLDDARGYF